MPTSHAESGSGISNTRQSYIHDDDSVLTLRQHATRTAATHAAWFLPYLRPGMALLDCGCASGSITVGLAGAVAPGDVTGIDISEVEIGRAKARAEEEHHENVSFAVGDVYALDFPDASFDALFSHNVLEHLAEPARAVMEMRRVLKPEGLIGLRDFDMGGMLLAPDSPMLQRFFRVYEADWERLNGHPRMGRQLVGLLAQAGFADVTATASYDAYSGPEGRKTLCELIAGRLAEEAYVTRILGCELATEDEICAMKEAAHLWQDLPDAFAALAHVEVVGRKP